jgi:SAM-dependent methyltransferase
MSSYVGRYAELYNLFYADKPYAQEAAFVHECLRELGLSPTREILELACGTGSHAFQLEKYGYHITATDYSQDMLQVARRRASEAGSNVLFLQSDLREIRVPATDYDAVVCFFDSIGYLKTNEALTQALAGIRRRLRPHGIFIFEFWHAPAMLSQYSPLRIGRYTSPLGEIIRISETTLDVENRLANVDYTVYELKNDGTYSTFREAHANRYFHVEEMRNLISIADMEVLKFFAGFQENESLDDKTWHVVAVVRKGSNSKQGSE